MSGKTGWDINALLVEAREHVKREPGVRLGQALYNLAYSRNPAVAHLSGTAVDPFYDDGKVVPFLKALKLGKAPQ